MKVRFRSLSRKSGRGTNPAPQCRPVQTRGCARTAGSGSGTHVTRHVRPRGRGRSSKDRRPRPGQALAPPDVIHTREEVHDPLTRRVRGNTTDEGERGVSFSKVFNGQIPKVAGVERRSVKPSDRHTAGLHGATGSGGRMTRRADSPARGPHAAEMQHEGRGAHAAAAGRSERERARPGAAGTAPPASAGTRSARGCQDGAACLCRQRTKGQGFSPRGPARSTPPGDSATQRAGRPRGEGDPGSSPEPCESWRPRPAPPTPSEDQPRPLCVFSAGSRLGSVSPQRRP